MQPATNSDVGVVPPGPALVYMPVPTRPTTYERYKHKQSIGLGITHIIISILCVVFNSVCIAVTEPYRQGNAFGFVGHGFWCGIMFLITGIFGVLAGKKKKRCQIVSFMVLSIISAVFTIALLVVGVLGAVSTRSESCEYKYNYGYYYEDYYPYYHWVCDSVPNYQVIIAMESCLAIVGLVEVIVAIWGSALTCGSGVCSCCCCCCSSPPPMLMPGAGYFPTTGQMICISQTQGGPYIYAPQPTFAYPQGLVPPPAYAQQAWIMPTTNIGQAPPAYLANQAQALWANQPATANTGSLAAEGHSTDTVPDETKERV